MSSINSLTGTSLLTYLQNLTSASTGSGTQSAGSNGTATAASSGSSASTGKASASMAAASQAALLAASKAHGAAVLQTSLDKQQTTLAADLRASLAKSGVQLAGPVSFSLSSSGKLTVNASDADKAALAKFMSADTGNPSVSSRLTKLMASAETLSGTVKQNAAISQAARYAGNSANVLSLYSTLSQQQDATPATFTLAGTGSSLTYAGVLTTKA